MKSSGGEPEGDTDHVLDLGGRHAEVGGYDRDAVAGLETINEVLDSRAAMNDEPLSERLSRVHDDLGRGVCGQPQPRGPAVIAVGDALEVAADDLLELALTGSDYGEHCLVVASLRVVEDDFRPSV